VSTKRGPGRTLPVAQRRTERTNQALRAHRQWLKKQQGVSTGARGKARKIARRRRDPQASPVRRFR